MDEMNWPEYQARLEQGAVVVLPVGAQEQHGRHLPLGTDTMQVVDACVRAAAEIDIVIAPPVPWGFKSQPRSSSGNEWPGNIGLDADVFIGLVRNIVVQLAENGASRIAVIDGNWENAWFLVEACDLAERSLRSRGIEVRIVRFQQWDARSPEVRARVLEQYPETRGDREHAARMETSQMMVIRPELVRHDLLPDHEYVDYPGYDIYPMPESWRSPSGSLATAEGATAELGELLLSSGGAGIAEILERELGARRLA